MTSNTLNCSEGMFNFLYDCVIGKLNDYKQPALPDMPDVFRDYGLHNRPWIDLIDALSRNTVTVHDVEACIRAGYVFEQFTVR